MTIIPAASPGEVPSSGVDITTTSAAYLHKKPGNSLIHISPPPSLSFLLIPPKPTNHKPYFVHLHSFPLSPTRITMTVLPLLSLSLLPALAAATPLFNNGTIPTSKSFTTKTDAGLKTATVLGPILGALVGVLILAWVGWVLHTARQRRRRGVLLADSEAEVMEGTKEGMAERVPEVGGLAGMRRAWLNGSRW